MFINDGKSLFGNKGLLVSLIILFVLLYLSYYNCYNKVKYINNNMIETFNDNSKTYIIINNENATDFIDDNGVNHGKFLQIGELEVYAMINGISTNISNNTNVTKTVTSSSEHGSSPNLQAIDGNPDTMYHSNGGSNNEWWKIQFDKLYTINKIIYFNRKDCCQIRAKGTELIIFNNKKIGNNTTHILNEDIKQTIDISNDNVVDSLPMPENVRIKLDYNNIALKFTIPKTMGIEYPSKFILVLAQYDSNKKNTGNNKFYLSNEYELNSSVNLNNITYETNICKLVDGKSKCSYKFNNLNISDETGNLFYYKLGISAVYNDINTSFVMPYNINTQDKLFTLNSSTDKQNQQYTDFLKYQENLNKKNTNILKNSSMISTADGQYELIKSQLGKYPDNLLLDEQTINKSLLDDLVDKNMSNGILNINVKMDEDDLNKL
jgi:hypothetical protein